MFLSTHLCQVLQPWRWYGSRFSGPVCLNRPYVVGSLLCQIGSASSLACLVYRSRSGQRSVELPMKENVSGYLRNPCSLSRERDTAFAAKLLTLPTGFFSAEKSEEWMARSPVWPDDVIASETASRHQPMNWRDSIWVQDSVTRRRSRSGQRSVSFPTQRTRVTQVTRDVLQTLVNTSFYYNKTLELKFWKALFTFNIHKELLLPSAFKSHWMIAGHPDFRAFPSFRLSLPQFKHTLQLSHCTISKHN